MASLHTTLSGGRGLGCQALWLRSAGPTNPAFAEHLEVVEQCPALTFEVRGGIAKEQACTDKLGSTDSGRAARVTLADNAAELLRVELVEHPHHAGASSDMDGGCLTEPDAMR